MCTTAATSRHVWYLPLFAALILLPGGATQASAQTTPSLQSFTLAKPTITGCKSVSADIVLTGPAPAGGTTVTLSSNAPQVIVPSSVKVAEGQTTRRITVKSTAVASTLTASVKASLPGLSLNAPIQLRPIGVASLSFASTVEGGSFVAGTVSLECRAAPSDIAVEIASSNPKAVAALSPRIVIPVGQTKASIELITSGVEVNTSQQITATTTSEGLARTRKLITVRKVTPSAERCLADDSVATGAVVPGFTALGTDVPGVTTQAAGRLACRRNQVVTVGFFNGDDVQRNKVQTIARQWEATGYILQFVDDVFFADVRIEFWNESYSESVIGVCSDRMPSEPTMHLNVSSDQAVSNQRVILHEFGHALGLVHEHQNPDFAVEWDVDYLVNVEYANFHNAAEVVQDNFIDRTMATNYTAFDPDSIMKYTLDPAWVLNAGELLDRYGADLFAAAKRELSVLDKHLVGNFLWSNYSGYEDQYLLGNWDGGRVLGVPGDKLAVRRGNCVLMAWDRDAAHDFVQCFGNGNSETLYAAGDWNGDGLSTLLVRRGNEYLVDFDGDGPEDARMFYGNHSDRMLIGDWNGDGTENVAVIQGNYIVMDYNWDGIEDSRFAFGNAGDILIAGDWNGDRIDDVAVVRSGIGIILDWDRDGAPNRVVQFGNDGDARVAGDWDGDGDDDLGVLRGNCLLMDYNLSGGGHEAAHCYGNGTLYRQLIP